MVMILPGSRNPDAATMLRVPERLWRKIAPIVERRDPAMRVGRRRLHPRLVLEAVLYHAVSGCGWKQLPARYPAESSVRRTFLRWQRIGIVAEMLTIIAQEDLGDDASRTRQPVRASTYGATPAWHPSRTDAGRRYEEQRWAG